MSIYFSILIIVGLYAQDFLFTLDIDLNFYYYWANFDIHDHVINCSSLKNKIINF